MMWFYPKMVMMMIKKMMCFSSFCILISFDEFQASLVNVSYPETVVTAKLFKSRSRRKKQDKSNSLEEDLNAETQTATNSLEEENKNQTQSLKEDNKN